MQAPSPTPQLTFPSVTAENLDGVSVKFPQGFLGDVNLVFVAFQQRQQREIDTWTPLALELQKSFPKLKIYEFPVIGKMIGFMRGMINRGMRRGIPDPATRAATFTVYSDKGAFMKPLGLRDQGKIYLVLVSKKGEVLWSAEGIRTEALEKSLRDFLAKLK
jgi:hypothetical protein